MSEQDRYTAQEMRDMAQCLQYNFPCSLYKDAAYMLRQAADAEEEIAQLKARLNAVVNECNMLLSDCGYNVRESHVDYVRGYANALLRACVRKHADAIIRAARGDGGAE